MTAEDLEISAAADAEEENPELSADEVSGDHARPSAEKSIRRREVEWPKILAFGVLPAVALLLAMAAGILKWQDSSRRGAEAAATESVATARETTAAILSYKADTADKELNAARDRLTGSFLEAYTKLVNDIVIPGAKEQKISAVAKVPAAAAVSATPSHAVALVFVDQTVTIGKGAPSSSASSVRVTLDKIGDRWLVSGFDPV